ncbi:uncharacterized protein LOC135212518 isoform X2 [Macrobrachium nipponense]|uniref:uncharacterized protein LOC135212518 isoform X2 n=1 Tax=Macrobrachium nipponense TaxID=159736 RepID=UPI0030C83571
MSLKKADTLITGDPNYYSILNAEPEDYKPCNNNGDVPVCDVQLPATPIESKHDPILSSAVLSYNSETQATIKLTPKSKSIDILEAIVMLESTLENILCTKKQITGHKCTIDWNPTSSKVLPLIITQKTSDQKPSGTVSWATNSVEIQDRELAVTQLGADIIEGRWLMLEGEYPGNEAIKSIYRLRKTVIDTNPLEYEDIEVDCSHLALEPRLCFGYFPHLESGKTYTLTVAYQGTGSADEMHQIESYPVTITASKPELEILSRHTTTHQNQQRADVQICFQHLTPTDGRSFSHYEMLIINEKGQWFKHSIMEEEEAASEERLCFAPFSINTNDFDLTEGTKVIISQRGADGITVLASGESRLF